MQIQTIIKNGLLSATLTLFILSCTNEQSMEIPEPEVISAGYMFTEGPYWHSDGFLLFSDIPANKVWKWHPEHGAEVFIDSSGNSNGITADINGDIILAQHARKVSRIKSDRSLEVIADNFRGSRFNSPNDITIHSNGTMYFTDPPFGVDEAERELDFSGVYMLKPGEEPELFYDGFSHPNGIAFSPDQSKLYVNNSQTGEIIVFEVDDNGVPANPEHFANIGEMTRKGGADGMKTDSHGNLYTTGPNGLIIFDSQGNQLAQRVFEEQITNLAWGGPDMTWLFLTATSNVYRFKMPVNGEKRY